MSTYPFAIVAAVNDYRVLQENLLRSPDIADGSYRVLIKEGFASASLAYNSAIDEAPTDTLIFVHQDVFLPKGWFDSVERAICMLDDKGTRWGVLGSFGSRRDAVGGLGQVYTTGLGVHGTLIREPTPVETLDEIVLVVRKSSGLRFDPLLPSFHMYGTDICLSARHAGLGSFAMAAFCVHNTNQLLALPSQFYDCHRYIKNKWRAYLPIATSCLSLTRFDGELHRKRLEEWIERLGQPRTALRRVDDPRGLLPPSVQGETT